MTIMRTTGSVRILSQAPESVIKPLIMPPQEGIQSMMEKTCRASAPSPAMPCSAGGGDLPKCT